MIHELIVTAGRIGFVVMAASFASALCGHWDHMPWRKH